MVPVLAMVPRHVLLVQPFPATFEIRQDDERKTAFRGENSNTKEYACRRQQLDSKEEPQLPATKCAGILTAFSDAAAICCRLVMASCLASCLIQAPQMVMPWGSSLCSSSAGGQPFVLNMHDSDLLWHETT